MVLPGVRAIFGFRLIAVFQEKFGEERHKPYQYLHLAALILVAVAATVIMTPAACHRIRNPREVTQRFIPGLPPPQGLARACRAFAREFSATWSFRPSVPESGSYVLQP